MEFDTLKLSRIQFALTATFTETSASRPIRKSHLVTGPLHPPPV
jgi:hypothetical protein